MKKLYLLTEEELKLLLAEYHLAKLNFKNIELPPPISVPTENDMETEFPVIKSETYLYNNTLMYGRREGARWAIDKLINKK